jgi:hypothetical protein
MALGMVDAVHWTCLLVTDDCTHQLKVFQLVQLHGCLDVDILHFLHLHSNAHTELRMRNTYVHRNCELRQHATACRDSGADCTSWWRYTRIDLERSGRQELANDMSMAEDVLFLQIPAIAYSMPSLSLRS